MRPCLNKRGEVSYRHRPTQVVIKQEKQVLTQKSTLRLLTEEHLDFQMSPGAHSLVKVRARGPCGKHKKVKLLSIPRSNSAEEEHFQEPLEKINSLEKKRNTVSLSTELV